MAKDTAIVTMEGEYDSYAIYQMVPLSMILSDF